MKNHSSYLIIHSHSMGSFFAWVIHGETLGVGLVLTWLGKTMVMGWDNGYKEHVRRSHNSYLLGYLWWSLSHDFFASDFSLFLEAALSMNVPKRMMLWFRLWQGALSEWFILVSDGWWEILASVCSWSPPWGPLTQCPPYAARADPWLWCIY